VAVDRWPVAECLEHLNLTGAAVLPAIHQLVGFTHPKSEG
jgi:hypothetical protein